MIQFMDFRGMITAIENFDTGEFGAGCTKMISMQNEEGAQANVILSPETYVLYQDLLLVGDIITAYYDANKPMILIYPPQYNALVIIKEYADRHVLVSHFNDELISEDKQLQLNIAPNTSVITTNGQFFINSLINRNLVVIYGPSTKSIPAQTTPYQVIVLC